LAGASAERLAAASCPLGEQPAAVMSAIAKRIIPSVRDCAVGMKDGRRNIKQIPS
jgi:hypothetical protein